MEKVSRETWWRLHEWAFYTRADRSLTLAFLSPAPAAAHEYTSVTRDITSVLSLLFIIDCMIFFRGVVLRYISILYRPNYFKISMNTSCIKDYLYIQCNLLSFETFRQPQLSTEHIYFFIFRHVNRSYQKASNACLHKLEMSNDLHTTAINAYTISLR